MYMLIAIYMYDDNVSMLLCVQMLILFLIISETSFSTTYFRHSFGAFFKTELFSLLLFTRVRL